MPFDLAVPSVVGNRTSLPCAGFYILYMEQSFYFCCFCLPVSMFVLLEVSFHGQTSKFVILLNVKNSRGVPT